MVVEQPSARLSARPSVTFSESTKLPLSQMNPSMPKPSSKTKVAAPISVPTFVPPHVFGRCSFERRLQLEALGSEVPSKGRLAQIALPSIVSPRQLAFEQAFAQQSQPQVQQPRQEPQQPPAAPPPPQPALPVPPPPPPSLPGAALLPAPDHMSFSPRVRYGKGSAHSPRHQSHFAIGSSPMLKPGTRFSWCPPGGAWKQEEAHHQRFC